MNETLMPNVDQPIHAVKKKMNRPERTLDLEMGSRLERAIKKVWGSHKALARHTQIAEQSLSRYVGGRIPAGTEMVKLAHALPGLMEWILTGRDPAEAERWVTRLQVLSEDQQASVEAYARVLASHDPDLIRYIPDEIAYSDRILQQAQRMKAGTPDAPHDPATRSESHPDSK